MLPESGPPLPNYHRKQVLSPDHEPLMEIESHGASNHPRRQVPGFPIEKLRHREVKQLTLGHTAPCEAEPESGLPQSRPASPKSLLVPKD